jgi:hypothetical protein
VVALRTERRVFLWRVVPRVSPIDATASVNFLEIADILENEFKSGNARAYLSSSAGILEDNDPARDEKHQLYIAAVKRDATRNTITLLINRGDPNIVSPAFIDSNGSKVRVINPTPTESVGYSAHLVISLAGDVGGHRAVFEQMPRVSSTLVSSALERIISRSVASNPKYVFEASIKKGKKIFKTTKPYRPSLTINRIPSERLTEDLQQGELSRITLTRQREFYTGPGSRDIITKQEEKIVIGMRRAEPSKVSEIIRSIIQHAKSKTYSSIQFHLEKLPGNATNNPTIAIDDHDALEQLYVRAQRLVNFPIFLEACYSSICLDIENKMIDIITTHAHW